MRGRVATAVPQPLWEQVGEALGMNRQAWNWYQRNIKQA